MRENLMVSNEAPWFSLHVLELFSGEGRYSESCREQGQVPDLTLLNKCVDCLVRYFYQAFLS